MYIGQAVKDNMTSGTLAIFSKRNLVFALLIFKKVKTGRLCMR